MKEIWEGARRAESYLSNLVPTRQVRLKNNPVLVSDGLNCKNLIKKLGIGVGIAILSFCGATTKYIIFPS